MKRSILAVAFAAAVSATPAPPIFATPGSPIASVSSIPLYPSTSSTDPYPSYSESSGAPSPVATSSFKTEGEGERKGKYVEEKREEEEAWPGEKDGFPIFPMPPIRRVVEEKREEEEAWPGEKDGYPIFPQPPIRRVAEAPVLTGFPPYVALSIAPKIIKVEEEGEAEVRVLPEITLDSATPTLPTLFIPVPTYEGEAEK